MNRPEMIRFILEDGTEANLEILEETKDRIQEEVKNLLSIIYLIWYRV